MKISFCTFCKCRLVEAKQTVPNTLSLMSQDDELIFVDYDDPEGGGHFVESLGDPRVNVVYVKNVKFWNEAHARNRALLNATKDIVVMIDIDNFISPCIIDDVRNLSEDEFYILGDGSNVYAFIASFRKNFLEINGYEEAFVNYGWLDGNLRNKMMALGLKCTHNPEHRKTLRFLENGARIMDTDDSNGLMEMIESNRQIDIILSKKHPYKNNIGRNWGRN